MFAAKAGHSTLGIPQSVGADFANADPGGSLPAHAPSSPPRPSSAVEAMTGLPKGKKRVRRGGGRHKKSHTQHMKDLQQHMASGNHAAAKSSALHLANALHAMSKSTGPKGQQGAPMADADGDDSNYAGY